MCELLVWDRETVRVLIDFLLLTHRPFTLCPKSKGTAFLTTHETHDVLVRIVERAGVSFSSGIADPADFPHI